MATRVGGRNTAVMIMKTLTIWFYLMFRMFVTAPCKKRILSCSKAEVLLHAGDIIDKFVDQDLKFRFCFVADLNAKVSRGTGKSELTFQAAGNP